MHILLHSDTFHVAHSTVDLSSKIRNITINSYKSTNSYNHTFMVSKYRFVKPLVAALFQVMLNGTFRNPTLLNSTSFLMVVNLETTLNHAGNNYVIETYIIQVLY